MHDALHDGGVGWDPPRGGCLRTRRQQQWWQWQQQRGQHQGGFFEVLRRLGAAALLEQALQLPGRDATLRGCVAFAAAVLAYDPCVEAAKEAPQQQQQQQQQEQQQQEQQQQQQEQQQEQQQQQQQQQQEQRLADGPQRQQMVAALATAGAFALNFLEQLCRVYPLLCRDLAAAPGALSMLVTTAADKYPALALKALGFTARGAAVVWWGAEGGGRSSDGRESGSPGGGDGGCGGDEADHSPQGAVQLLERLQEYAAAAGDGLAAAALREAKVALDALRGSSAVWQAEPTEQPAPPQQQQQEEEEEDAVAGPSTSAAKGSPSTPPTGATAAPARPSQPPQPSASSQQEPRACAACGKTEGSAGVRLRLCRGCFAAHFSSDDCYRASWPMHKLFCKQEQARRAAQPAQDDQQDA